MELFVEQGENRMDCELKIASRFNRSFRILSQKEIRRGGFLGLFSKPGVQVEYYFTPQYYKKPAVVQENPEEDLETRKRKIIAAAGKNPDQAMQSGKEAADQIINALNELKDKIEKKDEHSSFVKAAGILKLNDFSESYINSLMERMRKELPLEKLEDFDTVQEYLLEWIGESISIYKEEEFIRKPRIFILIGPTGVGKTTTIAKLAAFYGIGTDELPAIDVRMITIDAYRIGAKEQLKKIGDIMQIPVSFVDAEKPEQAQQALRKEVAIYKHMDMFFIDTIGKSPKDASKIGEMKVILEGAGRNAEYHLAISAATKASDVENILRQFEPFNYKSVVITKMDETEYVGNIISALAEKRKSISYITDGQAVPSDIKKASVVRFLINLDGFKINREKIEKRFPPGDADQFKWR